MRILLLALAALALTTTQTRAALPPAPETIATFSVVAYDPASGEVGVAVQSRFFAVGSVVPWCRAGVGAVATQAFGQPEYGNRALALASLSPHAAADLLNEILLSDDKREQRQLGMVRVSRRPDDLLAITGEKPLSFEASVDAVYAERTQWKRVELETGSAASYTGAECMAWAGGLTGVTPDGVLYAVQGNILAGETVVTGMASAFADPATLDMSRLTAQERQAVATPGLAGRMLAALLGGQAQGGDSRGMQSAALKVSQENAGYGGYNDAKFDLRVDDAADPFDELARLVNLAYPFALTNEAYRVLYAGDHIRAAELFRRLLALEPDNAGHHYNLACALSLGGDPQAALAELRRALEIDPQFKAAARGDADLAAVRALPEAVALLAADG